jgi:hypothetical protein
MKGGRKVAVVGASIGLVGVTLAVLLFFDQTAKETANIGRVFQASSNNLVRQLQLTMQGVVQGVGFAGQRISTEPLTPSVAADSAQVLLQQLRTAWPEVSTPCCLMRSAADTRGCCITGSCAVARTGAVGLRVNAPAAVTVRSERRRRWHTRLFIRCELSALLLSPLFACAGEHGCALRGGDSGRPAQL